MPERKRNIPFLDLSGEFAELQEEWFSAIKESGSRGQFILGPNVVEFEKEIAADIGVRHAIGVANGTDALMLALRALRVGVGDEVITTPFTFFASSEVISLVNARTVFADVDEATFNIDPKSIEKYVTKQTRAIIVVHLFGCPVNMNEIMNVARKYKLAVIEDCAQAYGAQWAGKNVGSIGDVGCFSFYPTKVLGCYGDGGLATTNNDKGNALIRKLRNHGATGPFMHDDIGYNSRLDEIQAALLRIKLKKAQDDIEKRRALAQLYRDRLEGLDIICPQEIKKGRHVYNLFTVRSTWRDRMREALTDAGVATSLCYPKPLHLQEVYKVFDYREGDLPVSEQLSRESLSLPIYPAMTEEELHYVCDVVEENAP